MINAIKISSRDSIMKKLHYHLIKPTATKYLVHFNGNCDYSRIQICVRVLASHTFLYLREDNNEAKNTIE
jgi:hypothetical protein